MQASGKAIISHKWPGRHSPVASADYASFVKTKARDFCFAGSLVKHQLSMAMQC